MVGHLHTLGFYGVVNQNKDFYKQISSGAVPKYDVSRSRRTCHNLTRTCHNLTRTCHNLTRTCHNLTRTCHNLTRTCHNLTRALPQTSKVLVTNPPYSGEHKVERDIWISCVHRTLPRTCHNLTRNSTRTSHNLTQTPPQVKLLEYLRKSEVPYFLLLPGLSP
jgi:hypothetical protein